MADLEVKGRPFFTVVLPTYNRAAMLRSAIESVLWQTFKDYECFVLDNHSEDDTLRVFAEYADRPNFRFVRFDENRGVQQSRNYAINHGLGQVITFLDSDDLWLPERLQEFRKVFQVKPWAGFVFSNAYLFRYGRIIGKIFPEDGSIPEGSLPGYFAVGEQHLPYVTTNLAVRREAFEKVGLYRSDIKLLDDTELYSRILADGFQVAVIARPLAVRTLHPFQITHAYAQSYHDALLSLRSGGAPPNAQKTSARLLMRQVALNMIKGAEPAKARQFLRENGGENEIWLNALTFTPRWILKLAREIRRFYFKARFGLFASAEYRRVLKLIEPLLGPHLQ